MEMGLHITRKNKKKEEEENIIFGQISLTQSKTHQAVYFLQHMALSYYFVFAHLLDVVFNLVLVINDHDIIV